ncbi:MAG: hypothetical protein ACXVLQ_14865 [Bacteriovorax sp.]
MISFQKKLCICFMGFSVLSIFNVNNAFAEYKDSAVKKISNNDER